MFNEICAHPHNRPGACISSGRAYWAREHIQQVSAKSSISVFNCGTSETKSSGALIIQTQFSSNTRNSQNASLKLNSIIGIMLNPISNIYLNPHSNLSSTILYHTFILGNLLMILLTLNGSNYERKSNQPIRWIT